jgi:nitrite reductase/ring-hydroxylating ferredoxin subunit
LSQAVFLFRRRATHSARASNHVAALPDKHLHANDILYRSVLVEQANLSSPKFRATFGVTDGILLGAIADSVRLHPWRFEALPAAPKWPNFDDRLTLLRRIS